MYICRGAKHKLQRFSAAQRDRYGCSHKAVGRHSRQLDMFSHDPVTFDRFAPERARAQDGPSSRAGGRDTHSFATRQASVTKLLARCQIVDVPQPETSLHPHSHYPVDISNMARNRVPNERRTVAARSFIDVFPDRFSSRLARRLSQVISPPSRTQLGPSLRHRVRYCQSFPSFPEHPLITIPFSSFPHFGCVHQAPRLFPQSQGTPAH